MEELIIRGDTAYRKRIYLLYALLVLVGVVAVRWLVPMGLGHLRSLGMRQLLVMLRALFIVILLSFAPAAIYLIVVGRRILKHERFPYPGQRVMYDTRQMTGARARHRGRALLILGTVFLFLMVVSSVYIYVRITGWLNDPVIKRYLFNEQSEVVIVRGPSSPHRID
jgi:hypothetical protein